MIFFPCQRLGETALILGAQRGSREVVVGLLEEEETDVTATNVSPSFLDNWYNLQYYSVNKNTKYMLVRKCFAKFA